jgi:saccharopine dehydrogenase-like NADP-dependent oxidoreductase
LIDLVFFAGDGGKKPESLNRVEELTDKKCTFYQVDMLDEEQLKTLFQKVCHGLELICHLIQKNSQL